MSDQVDLCIVGGGPAGMAAAVMAAEAGLSVVLLDDRPSAGGQIYRGVEDGPFMGAAVLGTDFALGSEIISAFRKARLLTKFGATIWRVDREDGGSWITYSHMAQQHRLHCRNLILATGAMERPVPFDGWTLPGVTGIGAAQLLLKTSALVPNGRIILAGNGPLLLLFATQLLALGTEITAILDTAPMTNRISVAMRNVGALFGNRDKVRKGLGMLHRIRSARIPVYSDVGLLVAHGQDQVTSISFQQQGKQHTIGADSVLIHEGVVPNLQLPLAMGCQTIWDDGSKSYRLVLDAFGESSLHGVFVVGDGAAINGAIAAPASAEIAVGRILERMAYASRLSRERVKKAEQIVRRERSFRPFLDALYPPRIALGKLSDRTLVCRCEEVRAVEVRAAIADGANGPAQVKVFTRCGMGPCQGRICGSIVSGLLAKETNRSMDEIDTHHVRFPLKPLTLGEMAQFVSSHSEGDNHAI